MLAGAVAVVDVLGARVPRRYRPGRQWSWAIGGQYVVEKVGRLRSSSAAATTISWPELVIGIALIVLVFFMLPRVLAPALRKRQENRGAPTRVPGGVIAAFIILMAAVGAAITISTHQWTAAIWGAAALVAVAILAGTRRDEQ